MRIASTKQDHPKKVTSTGRILKNTFNHLNDKKRMLTLLCIGGLAQLARAPHWQCGGQRFDSAILHSMIEGLSAIFVERLFCF